MPANSIVFILVYSLLNFGNEDYVLVEYDTMWLGACVLHYMVPLPTTP